MPDFTYAEIDAEVKRLGFTYPKDAEFTEDEIREATANLPEYSLTNTVATLSIDKPSAAVVAAFARMAALIKGGELSVSNGMSVSLPTTDAQRRQSALYNLKSARWALYTAEAKDSLAVNGVTV